MREGRMFRGRFQVLKTQRRIIYPGVEADVMNSPQREVTGCF